MSGHADQIRFGAVGLVVATVVHGEGPQDLPVARADGRRAAGAQVVLEREIAHGCPARVAGDVVGDHDPPEERRGAARVDLVTDGDALVGFEVLRGQVGCGGVPRPSIAQQQERAAQPLYVGLDGAHERVEGDAEQRVTADQLEDGVLMGEERLGAARGGDVLEGARPLDELAAGLAEDGHDARVDEPVAAPSPAQAQLDLPRCAALNGLVPRGPHAFAVVGWTASSQPHPCVSAMLWPVVFIHACDREHASPSGPTVQKTS